MTDHEDDILLAYQDSCSGLTLLLIHGFPLNSTLWESQLEDLSDVARVLAPDLRGHGLSGTGAERYSMALMAEDCMRLIEAVGVQEPVVVCGLSMGGYVAFEFLRRYPDWVGGLILVSTRAGADSAEGKAGRDRMADQVREEGATVLVESMLPKLLAPETYEDDQELVDFVSDMIESTSADGAIGALEAMKRRPDSTPMLSEITVPTLIIHGEEDQIIPVSEAETMLDQIPNAELAIISGAGHLPNLERPNEFNEEVWLFLDRLHKENDLD